MSTKTQLIAKIDAFLAAHEMPETTFGRLVANDTALVARLKGRGQQGRGDKERQISLAMYDKITDFMRDFRKERRHKSGSRQVAA